MSFTHTDFNFQWGTPLGFSVALFLFMNLIYFLVGIFPPILFRSIGKWLSIKLGLAFSPRSDVIAFGKNAEEVMKENPSALIIKTTVYDMITGLYLAYAVLHLCLVMFGLMHGERWALWVLTFSDLAIIFFYLVAARNFSRHLAPLKFSDLMPFATVPGIVLPLASALGFFGLYFN